MKNLTKTLTLNNVIILIKSVLNKDKNHYYYNKFSLAKKLNKNFCSQYNNVEIRRVEIIYK